MEDVAIGWSIGKRSRWFCGYGNLALPILRYRLPIVYGCREAKLMFEGLFQPMHLLVIFGIALLIFGPKKLPELGKGLGESIKGFKSAMKEITDNQPPK
jgi:sec-independent protein translocase protein TatA